MASEDEQRAAVVAEARLWVGTPYHHRAAVKGAGIDCARILIESFASAGLIDAFDPGEYPSDWHQHQREERYLKVIHSYCHLVDDDVRPLNERGPDFTGRPGDVLMWQWGLTFSHSAIVTDWPRIVHAFAPERSVVECDLRGTPMCQQPMHVYSFWGAE